MRAAQAERSELHPDVMQRAREGDADAFRDLVRFYDHRLRALAYRLLGDRARMDDVLQNAYVKAYRALPRFRSGAAPGTWLYRIVYNACIDDLRRAHRREQATDDLLDGPDGPLTFETRVVERSALAVALATLPPEQRAAVLLVDAQGFDYAAAAEVLGIPPGTVASRLNRARAALRRRLADEGEPR